VPDLADWTQLRRASWIVNGYLLAYIATMPLAGRAADRFGLPALFSGALVLFAIGSAAAGAAQDMDQLIAARVVQGMGGGAIVPLATAGASHLYQGAARARALGVVGALTFLGMAVGPYAGSAILERLDLAPALAQAGANQVVADLLAPSWRWVFYLGVPFALLALVYVWAAAPGWRVATTRERIDLLGAGLFTTALATGLLALTNVGSEVEFAGPGPLELGVVSLLAGVLAVVRFLRARDPFLEIRFFRNVTFSAAVLLSLLTGYALATAIIGAAVFVDRVRYGGAEEQRLVLGALAGAMAVGALGSGFALRRIGIIPLTLVGLAASIAGLGVLAVADPATDLPLVTVALAVFGLGFGLTVTPRSAAAVEALGSRAFGLASAAVTVARMMGMSIGLAVLTAFGSNRITELNAVVVDQAARDAVLPPHLRGRTLEDGLVVQALEIWAADQAATILGGLFIVAAVVTAAAILPTLAMRIRPVPAAGHTRTDRDEGGGRDDSTRIAPAL
jgi:MFS family permease